MQVTQQAGVVSKDHWELVQTSVRKKGLQADRVMIIATALPFETMRETKKQLHSQTLHSSGPVLVP